MPEVKTSAAHCIVTMIYWSLQHRQTGRQTHRHCTWQQISQSALFTLRHRNDLWGSNVISGQLFSTAVTAGQAVKFYAGWSVTNRKLIWTVWLMTAWRTSSLVRVDMLTVKLTNERFRNTEALSSGSRMSIQQENECFTNLKNGAMENDKLMAVGSYC